MVSLLILVPTHTTVFVAAMAAWGYCVRCQTTHCIPTTPTALQHAQTLRKNLLTHGRLDFDETRTTTTEDTTTIWDPLLNVSHLFDTRGKMMGVLVAYDPKTRNQVVLKAFAGKIRSYGWKLHGWADPIVDPEDIEEFVQLRDQVSQVTFQMEQIMTATNTTTDEELQQQEEEEFRRLSTLRSQLSREALEVLRQEQRVGNFRIENVNTTVSLSEIFLREQLSPSLLSSSSPPANGTTDGTTPIRHHSMPPARQRQGRLTAKQRRRARRSSCSSQMPVGVGECCATKLVHAAQQLQLEPIGIAEFFMGREEQRDDNRSRRRRVQNDVYYDSCVDRCQKVLGYMLCGSNSNSSSTAGAADTDAEMPSLSSSSSTATTNYS